MQWSEVPQAMKTALGVSGLFFSLGYKPESVSISLADLRKPGDTAVAQHLIVVLFVAGMPPVFVSAGPLDIEPDKLDSVWATVTKNASNNGGIYTDDELCTAYREAMVKVRVGEMLAQLRTVGFRFPSEMN